MTTRVFDRAAIALPVSPTPRSVPVPDAGYDAVRRFTALRDELVAARPTATRRRWKEPAIFFFDPRRQADLEAARPAVPPTDPYAELAHHIAAELPLLQSSVEVRRVARAIDGLRSAAAALASVCPAAKDLAELLAVPDGEVVVVLHPQRRSGFRLAAQGIADIGQLHILLIEALTQEMPYRFLYGQPMPQRLVAASREVSPSTPAGVPMIAEARFQMYTPAALRTDGTLPSGFRACQHWLWPTAPVASIPRINGERVVLIGEPAYRATWEVTRRFPAMAASLQLIEALSPARVSERLSKLTGSPVEPEPIQEVEVLSKAA